MKIRSIVAVSVLFAVFASGTPFWEHDDFERAERMSRSAPVMPRESTLARGEWQRWSYIHELFQTAAFVAGMQVSDSIDPEFGGIIEGEDQLSVVETDNTQQAIWVWSRYCEITGDTAYAVNLRRAWFYVMNHPAYNEENSGSEYYRVWNCGLALFAESKFRSVFGDSGYMWYADTCIEYMMAHPLSFVVGDPYYRRLHPKTTSLAAGMLYLYGKDLNNQIYKDTALVYGDRVRLWIEQDPAVNINDEVWAMSGGTAVWGLCRSVFDADTSAGIAWLNAYLPLMKYFQPTGNWNNSWNIWYANAYNFSGRICGNQTYLAYHHSLTDSMLVQDYDDDGGVPPTRGWNQNQDHTWVSNYMVFMGFEGLMDSIKTYDAGVTGTGGDGPRNFILIGDSVYMWTTAVNCGWMPLNSVNISMTGVFSADTVISLQMGQEDTVKFALPWIPADTGYFGLVSFCNYAGDERPSNDTVAGALLVRPLRTVQGSVTDSVQGNGIAACVYFEFMDDTTHCYFDTTLTDSLTGAFTVQLIDSLYKVAVKTRIPYPDLAAPRVYVTPDSISDLSFLTSAADLAIINRDDLARYNAYYSYILDTLGASYKIWVPSQQGIFPVSRMSEFTNEIIIWFTGRAASGTVMPAEQESLMLFLEGGGKLLISGQNIGEEIGATLFYQEYLHARLISDSIYALKVFPDAADPLGSRLGKFQTVGSGGANNQYSRDIVAADSLAHEFVYYDSALNSCAGIWYNDGVSLYKVVYFGFGFEAIHKAPWNGYVSRIGVLDQVLRWFGMTGVGENAALKQAHAAGPALAIYPNPFRRQARIALNISHIAETAELKIYDISGRLVKNLVSELQSCIRNHASYVSWDGTDQNGHALPSGIYFVEFRNSGSAVTKKVVIVRADSNP